MMMKIVLVLFVCVFSITDEERALIEAINNSPLSTWKATEYPETIMSPKKMASMLMKPVSGMKESELPKPSSSEKVGRILLGDTTSFDARETWGSLIGPPPDQGEVCGSDWAFCIAAVAHDRVGIATGVEQEALSAQDLISCDTLDLGCKGGWVNVSWAWFEKNGITTEACLPYDSIDGTNVPCPTTCKNGSEIVRNIKPKSVYAVPYIKMQEELVTNGPFEVKFDVYLDLGFYQKGVYKMWPADANSLQGEHAVIVAGWGTENNVPYWLLKNTWGEAWGENGYLRIVRGSNECRIEEFAIAGLF